MLNVLRRSDPRKRLALALEGALVARAREPVFFSTLRVPDSIDGRFDLVALHAWLVLARLNVLGEKAVAQALIDRLFAGFDEGLRELGAGDIGMGRRMKKIANAFFGRLKAYENCRNDAQELAAALLRNVYRGDDTCRSCAGRLAHYVLNARSALDACDAAAGEANFGPLPTP